MQEVRCVRPASTEDMRLDFACELSAQDQLHDG